jgi:hypothetical protein
MLVKPLPESVRLDAYNGVTLLVEVGRTAQGFYRDVVLLDVVCPAFEIPFADVPEKDCKVGGSVKDTCGE